MISFLARMRRAFLAGTVSLFILAVFNAFGLCEFSYIDSLLTGLRVANETASGLRVFYCLFFTLSPIIYFILLLISTAYIRKYGQSAVYQQGIPFVVTAVKCLGSDLTSPFRTTINVFAKYPAYYPDELKRGSRAISFLRLFWMIIWLIICVYGILWG